eukprot:TRINITY_DN8138_c0_g1_i2.p2 TRINITY_DN8138_c0_g1~~TRINITY_DN8138_c0_g1_i2.p2  ORF type:complete len:191 (-),score=28.33 TRINITY_DN8138_c0_g1_i2:359-931(-)
MTGRPRQPSPGPGSHDIPVFPEKSPSSLLGASAAFSMGSGARSCQVVPRRTGLGPGAHHAKFSVTERRHGGYGFGRQRRFGRPCTEKTPAADLTQTDNANFKRSPCFGFGTQEIGVSLDEKGKPGRGVRMPAPGDHNPDDRCSSQVKSGPAYSATPRRGFDEPVRKVKGPGPGSYDAEDKTKTAAAPAVR